MTEPGGPRWRAWTAAILILVLPFVVYLLIGSETPDAEPKAAVASPAAQATTTAAPVRPAAPSTLGRADLIEAAQRAADAYAARTAAPATNVGLAGKRFSIRLPFGCGGPAPRPDDLGAAGWHYDPQTETLRAQVSPEDWTEAHWARAASGQPYEAAEGFWIARPWSTSNECPAPAAGISPDQAAALQTLGIARFFEPGSSRAARKSGDAYRFSKKVSPENAPGVQGLRLLIEGRLSVDPSRQPIGCWSANPDARPICVFNTRLDRIAITDPSGGTVFSEWTD